MNIQNKLLFYLILFVYPSVKFVLLYNHILMCQEIYKKGGRKFVIPNLGPFGCLPFARALNRALGNTGACLQGVNPIVKLHNESLSKVLQELEGEFNGFKYSIVNSYTYLSEIIHNPSKYGMSWQFSWGILYFIIVIIWYFIFITN